MITHSILREIKDLDFTAIKRKLTHVDAGEGWNVEHADAVEREYRRFLLMTRKYPNEQIMPSFDVDVFWHYHILDTMKYAADCETVFGYFLHHFPYLGLRGEDDVDIHHQVSQRTQELYEQTFGSGDYPYSATHSPLSGNSADPAMRKRVYCALGIAGTYCAAAAASKSSYCAAPAARPSYCAAGSVQASYCAAVSEQASAAVATKADHRAARNLASCVAGVEVQHQTRSPRRAAVAVQ